VEVLNGYSAHGDRGDLRRWVHRVRGSGPGPRTVYLVHGEAEAQDAFAEALREDGFHVVVPSLGDRVTA